MENDENDENNGGTSAEFVQPSLDAGTQQEGTATLLPSKALTAPVVNSDKTDELSVALANSRLPKPVDPELEKPKPPGKYALEYSLKGQYIKETHATLPHALARIAALGRLGIVPATSTL